MTCRYFRSNSATGRSFWIIELVGAKCRFNEGRVGTPGKKHEQSFATEQLASDFFDWAIGQKADHGYVETASEAEAGVSGGLIGHPIHLAKPIGPPPCPAIECLRASLALFQITPAAVDEFQTRLLNLPRSETWIDAFSFALQESPFVSGADWKEPANETLTAAADVAGRHGIRIVVSLKGDEVRVEISGRGTFDIHGPDDAGHVDALLTVFGELLAPSPQLYLLRASGGDNTDYAIQPVATWNALRELFGKSFESVFSCNPAPQKWCRVDTVK
jgi:predicted DNA-binding WGR domain protein